MTGSDKNPWLRKFVSLGGGSVGAGKVKGSLFSFSRRMKFLWIFQGRVLLYVIMGVLMLIRNLNCLPLE